MKRNFGTIVLFVLIALTIVALSKIDAPKASAINNAGSIQNY